MSAFNRGHTGYTQSWALKKSDHVPFCSAQTHQQKGPWKPLLRPSASQCKLFSFSSLFLSSVQRNFEIKALFLQSLFVIFRGPDPELVCFYRTGPSLTLCIRRLVEHLFPRKPFSMEDSSDTDLLHMSSVRPERGQDAAICHCRQNKERGYTQPGKMREHSFLDWV